MSKILKIGSLEYKSFLRSIINPYSSENADSNICLNCWEYITFLELLNHEQSSHQCLNLSKIKSESDFLMLAKVYEKVLDNDTKV